MTSAARLLVNAAWPPGTGPAPADLVDLVTGAGGDGIGLPDSPRLFADPLVATERLLLTTRVPLAGPCVLAIGLRHPATAAAALRTLADAHGERLVAVLARGESAVRNEGLQPPSGPAYRSALSTVDELVGGAGTGMTLLGAASGPRTLADTAGRLGGVLVDVGVRPVSVAAALDVVRRAAPTARQWLFVRAVVTRDPAAATETLLGSCAARMAANPSWYGVSDLDLPGVRQVAAAYDYRTHGRGSAGGPSDAQNLVRDQFFLVGSADEVAAGASALARLGIDGIVLAGATGGLMARLADTIAALRRGLSPGAAR